jgi:hypothetical protein
VQQANRQPEAAKPETVKPRLAAEVRELRQMVTKIAGLMEQMVKELRELNGLHFLTRSR